MIYLGNQAVGVALGSVGGLTKYQKATVSTENGDITSNGSELTFSHNLGVAPKFVITKEAEGETATAGNINYMINGEVYGGTQVVNASTGNLSKYITTRNTTSPEPASLTNGSYYMDSTHVRLHQNANTTHWDTEIDYTIELWG